MSDEQACPECGHHLHMHDEDGCTDPTCRCERGAKKEEETTS